MNLVKLLGRYMNWADRFVAPRRHQVFTWNGFLQHGAVRAHFSAIQALAAKIEAGDNLTPYLSERIPKYGYVRPRTDQNNKPRGVEWKDKDYALNAYDTHHLHLSTAIRPDGWAQRTRKLLYASFTRRDVLFVMVGDHNSFDDGTLAQALAEARVGTPFELKGIAGLARERSELELNQLQRRGFTTARSVDDKVVLGAFLSIAGTSPNHTRHADRIADAIARLDPQIDEPGFRKNWFDQDGKPYPSAPVWEWDLNHGDLFLVETTAGVGARIVEWR